MSIIKIYLSRTKIVVFLYKVAVAHPKKHRTKIKAFIYFSRDDKEKKKYVQW